MLCVLTTYLYCQARRYIVKFNIHTYKCIFVWNGWEKKKKKPPENMGVQRPCFLVDKHGENKISQFSILYSVQN